MNALWYRHLETYELDALIDWHREEQYKAAGDEDYASAADHKRRAEELSSHRGKRLVIAEEGQ